MAQEQKSAAETMALALREKFDKTFPVIQQMVSKYLPPERLFALTVTTVSRNPELRDCTPVSIIRSMIIAAQLGLDVSGVGGKAYLVPYKNKETGKKEAQFIPGYRGLMELARRSGLIGAMYGRCVYQGEDFEYVDGLNPVLIHRPSMDQDNDDKLAGAWVVAVWTNGFRQFEVMNRHQIITIKKRVRGSDSEHSAWTTSEPEMWLKTVVRRICKKLPDDESGALSRALNIDDQIEAGNQPAIDIDLEDEPQETRTQKTKRQMKQATAQEDHAEQEEASEQFDGN